MILYRKNIPFTEWEIFEIAYDKEIFMGKTLYSVDCYFYRNTTAPNGDKHTKFCIGTNVSSKKELNTVLEYFKTEIQKIKNET